MSRRLSPSLSRSRSSVERLESRTLLSYDLVHAFPAVGNDPPVEGIRASGDKIYFAASTPTSGGSPRVFSSDGTTPGTVDLANGFDSGTFWRYGGPVFAGGKIYFHGNVGSGAAVWASDGTAAGTTRLAVKDGGWNNNTETNTWGAALGNRLVFLGDVAPANPTHAELFVTDGTDAGTQILSDALPTPHAAANTVLGTHNGLTYFTDVTTQGLYRLGVTDGTRNGTRIVADLNAGAGLVRPEYFTGVGNNVYFQLPTGQGLRLWKSDGTAAGTGPVDPTMPVNPGNMVGFGGRLYFFAGGALTSTDGTAAGTQSIAATNTQGSNLTRAGDYLWFSNGYNSVRGDGRGGLWRSDGTAAGTVQVLPNLVPVKFFHYGDRLWLGGISRAVDLASDPTEPRATGLAEVPWPYLPYVPGFTLAELGDHVYFPDAGGLYRAEIPDHFQANVRVTVFNDADGDGTRDAEEGGFNSTTASAFADLNNDGAWDERGEPGSQLSQDGTALIMGLPDGTYTVRVRDAAARVTTGAATTVTVADGQNPPAVVAGANKNVRVFGVVFDDRNADHERQPSEPGLAGRRVYLDADEDATFDDGEAFALTGADGAFLFQHLSGNGLVRVEPSPAGWRATRRAGGERHFVMNTAADRDFGDFGLTSQPPTGQVVYHAFLDYNSDGVQGRNEPNASNMATGFIDANNNNRPDEGEPRARGMYDQVGLPFVLPGTYRPGVVGPPGWYAAPGPEFTIASGQTLTLPPVALQTAPGGPAAVSGIVYFDDDFDGVLDADESPAAVHDKNVVFLDMDGDGSWSHVPETEPATWPDADGRYRFPGLPAGTYRVGFSPDVFDPLELTPVSPRDPAVRTVTFDGTTPVTDANLGIGSWNRLGRAAGRVYRDVNNDGTFDAAAGDVPVPNVLVYFDKFGNGYDPGDTAALTGADGRYVVPLWPLQSQGELARIAVAVPQGWTGVGDTLAGVTAVRYQTVAGPDFRLAPLAPDAPLPAAIAGRVFHDGDLDGTQDLGEMGGPLAGHLPLPRPHLDLDHDAVLDANEPLTVIDDRGAFYFGGLPGGNYDIRLSTSNGWAQTLPLLEPKRVFMIAGARVESVVMGAAHAPATARGTVYSDANANGVRDEGETPASGVRVVLDEDGNGPDASDRSTTTDASGAFSFSDLSAGVLRVAVFGDVNYRQTEPAAGPLSFTVAPGANVTGLTLGAERVAGTLTGRAFFDANRNGVYDAGEQGSNAPVRVQDTAVPTRAWDVNPGAGGVWTLDGVPAGTYRVSATTPAAELEQTAPAAPGTYTVMLERGKTAGGLDFGFAFKPVGFDGFVYEDSTGNGSPPTDRTDPPAPGITVYIDDNNNGRLDAGERTALTDATGKYSFRGLVIDRQRWDIRFVKPPQTVPSAAVQSVFTPSPGSVGLVNRFWFYRPTSRVISGFAYHDANANGAWDEGESPIVGRVIGMDTDRDGDLDTSDLYATTDDQGWYAFPRFSPRELYFVRDRMPANWVGTSPPNGGWQVLTRNATDTYTDVNFGSVPWPEAGRGAVFGRGVFYNAPQGAVAVAADAPAPAPDKQALLPGRAASFQNVTTYFRGLNGVTVDLAGLPPDAALTADDFDVAVSADPAGGAWSPAGVTPAVSVVPGAGLGGSHRVLLTFPDNAVRNTWLRVTVKPTARTLLDRAEVFYFGNVVGDTGDGAAGGPFRVNALDLAAVKRALGTTAAADSRLDFNRDGRVNALDLAAVKGNLGRSLPAIVAPPPPATAPAPAAPAAARLLDEQPADPLG